MPYYHCLYLCTIYVHAYRIIIYSIFLSSFLSKYVSLNIHIIYVVIHVLHKKTCTNERKNVRILCGSASIKQDLFVVLIVAGAVFTYRREG